MAFQRALGNLLRGRLPSKKDKTPVVQTEPDAPEGADMDIEEDFVPPLSFSQCQQTRRRIKISDWEPLGVLGKGSFGRVYLVQKRPGGAFTTADNQCYALKAISKKMVMDRGKIKDVFTEREVLQRQGPHPFIVNLHWAFHSVDHLFFVLDNAPGGDVSTLLNKQPGKRFPEVRARVYAAEVFVALSFLHSSGVMYRDLKPENLLLSAAGHVLLCDFGLSKVIPSMGNADRTSTFVGSPYYVAPDVLKQKPYTKAIDWWSYGVFIYHTVTGQTPWTGRSMRDIFSRILHNELEFPPDVSKVMSATCQDLVSKLLVKDPANRLTEAQIKAHPWFGGINWDELYNNGAKHVPVPWPLDHGEPAVKPLEAEDAAILAVSLDQEGHSIGIPSVPSISGESGPFKDFSCGPNEVRALGCDDDESMDL